MSHSKLEHFREKRGFGYMRCTNDKKCTTRALLSQLLFNKLELLRFRQLECHNNQDLLRISVIAFNHELILKHSHKHVQNVRGTKSFQQEGRWQTLFLIQKVNDLPCGPIHSFFSSLTLDKTLSLLLCLWI